LNDSRKAGFCVIKAHWAGVTGSRVHHVLWGWDWVAQTTRLDKGGNLHDGVM